MNLSKKVVMAAGILLLAIVGYVGYYLLTPPLSPPGEAQYDQAGVSLKIEYSRPYKKDRLIFGTADEGALLPYGKYWRLGANDATKLILDTDVDFGGQPLKAGSYSLYAFPEQEHWIIGINSEANRSGGSPPDFSRDIGRIKIPVITTSVSQEQFTISIEEKGAQALVVMHWDTTRIEIPVKSAN